MRLEQVFGEPCCVVETDQVHPDIADLQQMAAELRVSPRTVVQWVRRGDMPGSRIGGHWRFYRPAVRRAASGDRERCKIALDGEPDLRTAEETGALLGLHVVTVRQLLRTGVLPALRLGREWRVDWRALLQDIADGRSYPTSGRS